MMSTFALRATITFFLGLGFAVGGMTLLTAPETGGAPAPYLAWVVCPLAWASVATVARRMPTGNQESDPNYGLFQRVVGLVLSLLVFLYSLGIMTAILFPTMSSQGPDGRVWVISFSLVSS